MRGDAPGSCTAAGCTRPWRHRQGRRRHTGPVAPADSPPRHYTAGEAGQGHVARVARKGDAQQVDLPRAQREQDGRLRLLRGAALGGCRRRRGSLRRLIGQAASARIATPEELRQRGRARLRGAEAERVCALFPLVRVRLLGLHREQRFSHSLATQCTTSALHAQAAQSSHE